MKFTLRNALPDDLEEILQLFEDTIRIHCSADYSPAQIQVWVSGIENKQRWLLKMQQDYFLVALQKQKIVGFASLENGEHVDLMYVHKDHQHHGIASTLFAALKAEATQQGKLSLTADVSFTAKPFFENVGFMLVKKQSKLILGVEISNYAMVLQSL